jgi:spermidine synthase
MQASTERGMTRAPVAVSDGVRRRLSLALMAASGFAGLGYQIVWTQQCAVWLGHESAAVLAVIAAFFGGLALGAFTLGPRIERSADPVRWYAACEVAIALWGVALIVLMAPFGDAALTLVGTEPTPLWQWTVAFCGTFVLLLPATAAMGATLPAMARVTTFLRSEQHSIGALYAANTFGAVTGVLATAFWLVPELGLVRTAGVCIALNLLCAAAARPAFARDAVNPGRAALDPAAHPPARRGALARLALTGLLGIGYEVVVVRVLSQFAEDTVYTFAMLLAVYLLGSALGAALHERWRARCADPAGLQDRLLAALSSACLLGAGSLWAAEHVQAALTTTWGPGVAAGIGAEAALALIAFAGPTLVMGALFSHLCARADASGAGFARSLAANTLGAAAAPLMFGVVLVPLLGPKTALLLIALAYLALTVPHAWARAAVAWPGAAALATLLWAPPLAFVALPEGGRIVSYQEGAMAAVSVVEDAQGVLRLRIDNRQQEASSATLRVDARQALIPLLLHPAPHRALFLGLGTGNTASAAAADPRVQADAVELLPEVIAASPRFAQAAGETAAAARVQLVAADARRYVRATERRYDLIVSDNFHPARSGSGALWVEHFGAVRARLAPGGLFCQWLPLHQLDLATLRSIVRSFIAVYPDAAAVLANNSLETPVIGLLARAQPGRFEMRAIRERLARNAMPTHPAQFGLEDEYALLGSVIAGPAALAQFAADTIANTDDHPVVA